MSRPLRIPRPGTTLHLYRHLLRESSYLPPFARSAVDYRIKGRFRRHRDAEGDRLDMHLSNGHRELRAMRAAVAGDMPRMYKLLLQCFGRIGHRRRRLLEDLLQNEPSTDIEMKKDSKTQEEDAVHTRKPDWLDKWDTDKLMVFARTQVTSCEQVNKPGQPLQAKQLVFKPPAENIWGRPIPPAPMRAKLRKHWARIADRLLPPLPPSEWDMLRDLAHGKGIDPEWAYQRRRPLARTLSGVEADPHPWKWEAYVLKKVSSVDYQANRKNKLLSGALDDNSPRGDPEPLGTHTYTPNRWRRMLMQIWRLSAKMERKPDGKGWNIVWGTAGFPLPVADMEFFEGSDPSKGASGKGRKGARNSAERSRLEPVA